MHKIRLSPYWRLNHRDPLFRHSAAGTVPDLECGESISAYSVHSRSTLELMSGTSCSLANASRAALRSPMATSDRPKIHICIFQMRNVPLFQTAFYRRNGQLIFSKSVIPFPETDKRITRFLSGGRCVVKDAREACPLRRIQCNALRSGSILTIRLLRHARDALPNPQRWPSSW